MTIIDNGVYVNGHRTANPQSLDETYELMRARGGMAWIGLYRPDPEELRSVAQEFGLHELAVEDALKGHQRSKLERYGSTLFAVLRPARYLDAEEKVEFGEIHVFVGEGFVVTVRHAESPNLAKVRQRMEANPELLALGPQAVLYAILDQVVDEYAPVSAGVQIDVEEIEDQLFGGSPDVSRRIYELSREVLEFQRAINPLEDMLTRLRGGAEKYGMDVELYRKLGDVLDHVLHLVERVASFRALLGNALTLASTLASQRVAETGLAQNEDTKRISAWAAIFFAPSLIGAIYGMNFTYMPELDWPLGYPFALGLMVLFGFALYLTFKRNKWL